VISWLPDGDSFRIHDVETFSKDVLPKYCNGIQYKSFIRNINLYCFQRVREGKSPNVGAYYHPMFKQGQLELCLKITRPKRPRQDGKKKQSQKVHKDEGIENIFEAPVSGSDTDSKSSTASFRAPNASLNGKQGHHQIAQQTSSQEIPPPRNPDSILVANTTDFRGIHTSSPHPRGSGRTIKKD